MIYLSNLLLHVSRCSVYHQNIIWTIKRGEFNFFSESCCRSHVTFNVDSASAIQQAAHIQVITKNLYAQDGQRIPARYGVLDRRMVSFDSNELILYSHVLNWKIAHT